VDSFFLHGDFASSTMHCLFAHWAVHNKRLNPEHKFQMPQGPFIVAKDLGMLLTENHTIRPLHVENEVHLAHTTFVSSCDTSSPTFPSLT
jgi:hypothetical protein